MQNQKLLGLYGLKWNPFISNIPNEALISTREIDQFCWKIESLVIDGGYAMVTGDPGLGKSVAMRILANRLAAMREIKVGVITRPQSGLADFYRELGYLFELDFKSSNRWGGYRALREKWAYHIKSTLFRPIILIDECQEMNPFTLNELRFLASTDFDSKSIVTIVMCGDDRLTDKFKSPDLIPLGSRIRTRLNFKTATRDELENVLEESISRAGNINLMSKELKDTLVNHSAGNFRVMMNMAAEILMLGISKEVNQLDETLFFEAFNTNSKQKVVKKNLRSS